MKKIRMKEAFSRRLCILLFTILISLFTTSIGGCVSMIDDKDSISELSFNHDGKKVVFDRCKSGGCQIQVYDLETSELAAYQSPKGERWTMGKYSYDGKRIAFSVIPIKQKGGMELGDMQIAVMDADGKKYKKVTTGPGAKLYPTFSHNGKKILYARAAFIRKEGKTPAAQYDAWEINLETGEETQLTHFKYFYMGYLTYYPDDERFIYYWELPEEYEGVKAFKNQDAFKEKMIELSRQGKGIHGIVVMKGKELMPDPYNIDAKMQPQKPLLSRDASKLIFEKSLSGGKFFIYSSDGNHRLVGEGGSVDLAAISPDGELLGMTTAQINIFTVKDSKLKQILYLPYELKNFKNNAYYRENERLFRMIPDKPSHIIN